MLAIHTNPVVATTSHGSGVIAAREHLPGTKTHAGACLERFLECVGCLHLDRCVAASCEVDRSEEHNSIAFEELSAASESRISGWGKCLRA